MNKRGFGFPSIYLVFVLVLVIVVLASSQSGVDTKTIDKTIETLNWSKIGANVSSSLQKLSDEQSQEYVKVILGICQKGIDFMGYSIFAVSKLAMQLARDNPNIINWRVLFTLLILSLIAPFIYPLFMISVSLILIIREWYLNKKEKKNLEKLKKHE